MEFLLEERICAVHKCNIKFKVLKTSDQEICSKLNHSGMGGKASKLKMKKDREGLKLGTEMIRVEPGMMGPGEQKKESGKERSAKRDIKTQKKEEQQEESIEIENIKNVQNLERSTLPDQEEIIKKTKKSITPKKMNGEEKIKSTSTESKESTMQKTEKGMQPKSTNEEGSEIQQSDFTQQSVILNQENESSIQLLTNSAEHLVELAKSLAAPISTDENGEVIRRSPTHELDVAVKCLSEARNVMKTKLEYLKFGHELIKDSKSSKNQ